MTIFSSQKYSRTPSKILIQYYNLVLKQAMSDFLKFGMMIIEYICLYFDCYGFP